MQQLDSEIFITRRARSEIKGYIISPRHSKTEILSYQTRIRARRRQDRTTNKLGAQVQSCYSDKGQRYSNSFILKKRKGLPESKIGAAKSLNFLHPSHHSRN